MMNPDRSQILGIGIIYHLRFIESEALIYVIGWSPESLNYETVKLAGTIVSHNMYVATSSLRYIGPKNITPVPVDDLVLYVGLPYVSDAMITILKKIADRKPVYINPVPGKCDGGYHLIIT